MKTIWYKSYIKVLGHLKNDYKDIKVWLQKDPDSKPDLELWVQNDYKNIKVWLQKNPDSKPDLELWKSVGVGQLQYLLDDLKDWLDLQNGGKKKKSQEGDQRVA